MELEAPEAHSEKHVGAACRGISVQFSRVEQGAEYAFKWQSNLHYLAYHDLVLEDGEMSVQDDRPIHGRDLRGTMTYLPAEHKVEGWAKPAKRVNSFTVVYFDPAILEEELQTNLHVEEQRNRVYFQHETLGATMRKLTAMMANDEAPLPRIYVETIGLTAALEVSCFLNDNEVVASKTGALTNSQASLINNYITEHLSQDIGLDDLAAVCGLSRFHFARAFKATFGETPSRFVTGRRIDKSKEMLSSTVLTIAEVSIACGFNGATQFGRTFRGFVGLTPMEFRRKL
ncbi:helix-turn-helix domain-containing protein [Agrobacterium pusense]|uniref:helix-turn-helix domain-containing protein n=1 Tax=Agrobacterium pusense TaxID=648995 RepID=UPI001300215D|nr:helix-turn-helix domain-containing protein [Agrobacterium pusense]